MAAGAVTTPAIAPETALARFGSFDAVVDLIRANRDVKLLVEVENHLRLARYSPGRIEFEPTPDAPRDLASRLAQRLQGWTGVRWGVSVVAEGGAPTIAEDRDAEFDAARAGAMADPLVQAVFAAFPGAKITAIRSLVDAAAEAPGPAPNAGEDGDDDWNPFED
jgi:DNA polymerase-3 subunit gamma/tau